MESVKVYRNPWVRAELAENFTIDVVLHDAQNGLCPPPTSIFLGPRNRGICEKKAVNFEIRFGPFGQCVWGGPSHQALALGSSRLRNVCACYNATPLFKIED